MYHLHPADELGILDEGVRVDVLLCAWHLMGEEVRAEKEGEAALRAFWGL